MTDPNRRFAELAGIEYTGQDYNNAMEVLKVMMAADDWPEFRDAYPNVFYCDERGDFLRIDYSVDRTGKLRDLASEFMEGRK